MTWIEREPFRYWKGAVVVELGRSMIEYRTTDTHRHFVVSYERLGDRSIIALNSDLREWDQIKGRSEAIEPERQRYILNEMQKAISVAGIAMNIVNTRPVRYYSDLLVSTKELVEYLDSLSRTLRDAGCDALADETFETTYDPTNGHLRNTAVRPSKTPPYPEAGPAAEIQASTI
jgi:hypothetical protein